MRDRYSFVRRPIRLRSLSGAILVAMSFVPPLTWAQDPQASKQTLSKSVKENKVQVTAAQDGKLKEMPWTKDFEKYPGLQHELTKLLVKIGDGIQAPEPRTESRLLALLPETTVGYAALPNYGNTAGQALKIFRQELQESTVLHDWWGQGEMPKFGEKLLGGVEKFRQIEEYLGEELVLSAAMDGKDGKLLFIAETKKLGLKKFLDQMIAEDSAKSFQGIRVIGPEDLATVKEKMPQDLLILVREDYVIGAFDAATLTESRII